jgi:hypothetical protein
LTSSGSIEKWGYCLEDCPGEDLIPACLEEPQFPEYPPSDGFRQNFTTDYVSGSYQIIMDMDYVSFQCPSGYAFEGSTNVTHYAICHNWQFNYQFDLEATCIRIYKYVIDH